MTRLFMVRVDTRTHPGRRMHVACDLCIVPLLGVVSTQTVQLEDFYRFQRREKRRNGESSCSMLAHTLHSRQPTKSDQAEVRCAR